MNLRNSGFFTADFLRWLARASGALQAARKVGAGGAFSSAWLAC